MARNPLLSRTHRPARRREAQHHTHEADNERYERPRYHCELLVRHLMARERPQPPRRRNVVPLLVTGLPGTTSNGCVGGADPHRVRTREGNRRMGQFGTRNCPG